MERFGTGYLEERKLVQRWPQPIPAIVALVLTLAIFYATWWIFQDPRGWMRMYTPYVGYMYTRWWLIMLIWMVYIFNYWPFKRVLAGKHSPARQGSGSNRDVGCHPVGAHQGILRVVAGQLSGSPTSTPAT